MFSSRISTPDLVAASVPLAMGIGQAVATHFWYPIKWDYLASAVSASVLVLIGGAMLPAAIEKVSSTAGNS